MLATAFGPFAPARDLEAAGCEQEQAEALAAQLRVAAGADRADLATKADVGALRGDIDALRAETKADREALRAEFYRTLRIQGGATVAIFTALRFLPLDRTGRRLRLRPARNGHARPGRPAAPGAGKALSATSNPPARRPGAGEPARVRGRRDFTHGRRPERAVPLGCMGVR